jgi:hypothetical protein
MVIGSVFTYAIVFIEFRLCPVVFDVTLVCQFDILNDTHLHLVLMVCRVFDSRVLWHEEIVPYCYTPNCKQESRIPKGKSEPVYRKITHKAMAKRKSAKGHPMLYQVHLAMSGIQTDNFRH